MEKLQIIRHYEEVRQARGTECYWHLGPVHKMPEGFCVLELPPNPGQDMWTYGTCGMSLMPDKPEVEVHLFSREQDRGLVEILYFLAYYHTNTSELGVKHTVNIGQPWKPGSPLDHGLISKPYIDGPKMESLKVGMELTKFYWLIPVTKSEVQYKVEHGADALEELFESTGFNYLDPFRSPVV